MFLPHLERVEQADRPGRVSSEGVGDPTDAKAEVGQGKVGSTLQLGLRLSDGVEDLIFVNVSRVFVVVSVHAMEQNINELASGSLDLVDLHGVGGLAGTIRDQSRGRGSISYHPIPLARPKS